MMNCNCGGALNVSNKGINMRELNAAEKELIKLNHKIMAIKAYREDTGASLLDAKNKVDEYDFSNVTVDEAYSTLIAYFDRLGDQYESRRMIACVKKLDATITVLGEDIKKRMD